MARGSTNSSKGVAGDTPQQSTSLSAQAACQGFAEAAAWKSIGPGWRPLFGSYRNLGFSFEWHEFEMNEEFNWARSFHPGSIELCLNLDGSGKISDGHQSIELVPQSLAFYYQGNPSLVAVRNVGSHCFITIEFSPTFLKDHFQKLFENLHPLVRSVVLGEAKQSVVTPSETLLATLLQLVGSLRHCPVFSPAQEMWFRSKALEIASHLFFRPPQGEMLCTRTQRLARERIEKARMILREHMQNPPSLEALARMVHCSSFYLSRQFARETGMTMQQFLREVRMERAADLLKTGRCNVTEAALEVGYNSLSHFSTTFHQTFGCCPGLYPTKTEVQKAAWNTDNHGSISGAVS